MLKLFILLVCAMPAVTASAQNISFQHDGLDRRYRIHIPDSLPGNSPLVVALHGYGGNNNDMMNNYGWTELADEEGFVVVFPNGTRDQSNNRFWDVDYDFHQGIDIDDDGFLSSLAIHLQNLHGLDPERTFVTGFSNGAEMCIQLACREPETFTAFAPIIGMMLDTLFTNCNPAVVRPILSMNGTSDSVTLYKGDMNNSGGWGAYRSIPETMAFWADIMETPTMTRTFLPNSDPNDGSTVRLDIYTSTEHDRSLWYYLVIGGGHDYPGQWGNMDIDATREAWNFFKLIDPCTDCIVDCNDNGIADSDDIAMGEGADINGDLLLDECAWECPGDIDRNGITDVEDFSIFLIQYGGSGTADIAGGGPSGNGPDGTVDLTDFSAFLVSFGCVVSD
ncbi:MAG: PHB depolymerase family esterase [Phycisphaerales bacterium]|nr:PHB depolymerase family esterase [Phycisphaerales bacterium]